MNVTMMEFRYKVGSAARELKREQWRYFDDFETCGYNAASDPAV
jgi:hypothetical protein